jgi:UDP-3-O-[3-hydroxymyristoyl] glucosamine N-acyltransferase
MTTRTLIDLAKACGASLEGDAALEIRGPASLRDAQADEVAFCGHPRFRAELERTRAGAVLVPRDMAVVRSDISLLRCDDPNRAFTQVAALFVDLGAKPALGVHPSAVVEADCELGAEVSIGPLCHIGARTRIGARTILRAGVCLGEAAQIGEDCELFPHVVLYPRVRVGARCVIHAGSVLGSDGHGFEPSAKGWTKIPQCGTVVVEDDVEIGANTTIDRARFGVTRIGRGSKIDNLVHIAHNVVIGEAAMIVAQAGIAGSTRLGKRVVLGGQVGVSGHLELGDDVRVGGQGGVIGHVHSGLELWGTPARPIKETLRTLAHAARADQLVQRVRELERRLSALEAGGSVSAADNSTSLPAPKEIR